MPDHWLFAYGTLGPRFARGRNAPGWRADAVRGRLYDLGPYPILLDAGDPSAPWVEGHVRPVTTVELEGPLDAYEGVAEGMFRREQLETRGGLRAWVYLSSQSVPEYARGPLSRWDGPAAAHRTVEESHDGEGPDEGEG